MIRYLRNNEIDRQQWDQCINHAHNRLLYAFSWYLDEACVSWDALVLDDYMAVFPLPKNSKFGLKYSLQPVLSQQLGLFSQKEITEQLLREFLTAIPKHFLWVKLNLNYSNRFPGISLPKKTNLILNLSAKYEELYSQFNTGTKRKLKKIAKNGGQISEGTDSEQILDILSGQVVENNIALSTQGREKLVSLVNTGKDKGIIETYGFTDAGGQLCAGAIIFMDKGRLYYLIGTSNTAGLEQLAMFGIIDFIIAKYSGRDFILDFEGSEIPGVARFFEGFGATDSPYPVFERRIFGRKSF